MKTIIHAKAIDQKVRTALYGMLEFSAVKLFPRRMKNVSIKLHLKHYVYEGEAMIEEDTRIKNPRNFKIIIDPYRMEKDDWERELNYSEWVSKILRTLGHEMVHVKQYIMGELTFKRGALSWKKEKVGWMSEDEYYCSPHEVEAYGKEKWLQLGYTAVWNEIQSREDNRLQKL
jgi:hypothetical protein